MVEKVEQAGMILIPFFLEIGYRKEIKNGSIGDI
jgi:hypothetical protein